MDSGSPTSHTVPAVDVYDREGLPYHLLVNVTGCNLPSEVNSRWKGRLHTADRLECLRDLPYEVLLNATLAVTQTDPFQRQLSVWGPSYKPGSFINERPSKRLSKGKFLNIPMIMGSNKDEGTLAAYGAGSAYDNTTNSPDDYFFSFMSNTSVLDLSVIDPQVYEKVAELYPDDPSAGSPFDTSGETFGLPPIFKRLAAWFGDIHYQAPRRLWAGATCQHQPIYVYYFDGPRKSTDPSYAGVPHSSELPLIFGSFNYTNLPDSEIEATTRLAMNMRNHYIHFVHDLHPGSDWPAYVEEKKVMRFNKYAIEGELVSDDWRIEQIEYINSQPSLDTYQL